MKKKNIVLLVMMWVIMWVFYGVFESVTAPVPDIKLGEVEILVSFEVIEEIASKFPQEPEEWSLQMHYDRNRDSSLIHIPVIQYNNLMFVGKIQDEYLKINGCQEILKERGDYLEHALNVELNGYGFSGDSYYVCPNMYADNKYADVIPVTYSNSSCSKSEGVIVCQRYFTAWGAGIPGTGVHLAVYDTYLLLELEQLTTEDNLLLELEQLTTEDKLPKGYEKDTIAQAISFFWLLDLQEYFPDEVALGNSYRIEINQ